MISLSPPSFGSFVVARGPSLCLVWQSSCSLASKHRSPYILTRELNPETLCCPILTQVQSYEIKTMKRMLFTVLARILNLTPFSRQMASKLHIELSAFVLCRSALTGLCLVWTMRLSGLSCSQDDQFL